MARPLHPDTLEPDDREQHWVMPEWMRAYSHLFLGTMGMDTEAWMNGGRANGITYQVEFLEALRNEGLLKAEGREIRFCQIHQTYYVYKCGHEECEGKPFDGAVRTATYPLNLSDAIFYLNKFRRIRTLFREFNQEISI